MKKKRSMPHSSTMGMAKILMRMKLLTILVLSVFTVSAADSYSQVTKFNLKLNDVAIIEVFQQIEENSEFILLYNEKVLDLKRKVTVDVKNQKVTAVLDQVFKGTKNIYKIYDRQIVILENENAKVPVIFENKTEQPQNKKIKGHVTDQKGGALPGVSVIVKGTTIGTITDADGNFTLSIPNSAESLQFSFIGMKTQVILIEGKTEFNILLEEESFGIDEVVTIGYGTAKKSDLTGAVIRIDGKSFQNQPMTQLTDMLTGTVAGFYSRQGTSASGGSSMEIRGTKSLKASSSPMIVIDGVIYNGSIKDINPADIESIDILKDASSAAVFGARAAAGVIQITTKKGKKGKPIVNFSASIGATNETNELRPYDGEGYQQFRRDYLKAVNPDKPNYYFDSPDNLPEGVSLEDWRNASDNPQDNNTEEYLARLMFYQVEIDNYNAGKQVNWYDEVMRTGLRQNYDASISGATDRVNYYWSIGYQNNEGIIIGDEFQTVRTRLNFDLKVNDWLDVGINSQFADRNQSSVKGRIDRISYMSPYGSMYGDNGDVKWYPNTFPVSNPLMNYYGQDRFSKSYNLFASMYAKLKLPFGIEYKISYQPRYSFLKDYNFWSSNTITGGSSHSQGYGSRKDASSFEWILDHLIHWKKEFGVHSFDLTLLYSAEQNNYWSGNSSNEGFVPNQNLGFHGLQFGTKPAVSNYDSKVTGDAAMARINYDLMGKYLLTASIRRDGYSAFGLENPRAVFPAAAFAWKVSNEEFFNVDWISQLKARVSWGVNGNRSIGAYSALAQLRPNFYYDGTNVQVGVYNNSLANSSLVWERTEAFNIGFDLGMFDNRLSVVAEYYNAKTNDLLMERQLPRITGFSSITTNLGEIGNKGLELTLNSVNINNSNFSWRTSVVFSFNRNEIIELYGDYEEIEVDGEIVKREIPDYSNEWFPGQAIDAVWDYNVTGVWQLNEKDEAAKYNMIPGEFKSEDVNKDYAYTALEDKQFIGYTKPRYLFGMKNDFTFLKDFTASFFIRADLGHMARFYQAYRRGGDTYDKRSDYDIPYWTPENPINDYASLISDYNAYGGGMHVYKSRSFVRLQDLSISYQMPSTICQTLKVNSIRIFGSGRNLLTFTEWPGWDPESGNTPMPKIVTLGINVSL